MRWAALIKKLLEADPLATCAGKSTEREGCAMGARIRPFAVVRSGGQWRGTSGTAAGCSGPSRPEDLGRGPADALRFGAGRAEPPRARTHPSRSTPFLREGGFARTGRPLVCPKCGAKMKIAAFLERRSQPAVVERILKHCGLWDDTAARGPPAAAPTQDQLALEEAGRALERPCGSKGCGVPQGRQYVDTDEFLARLHRLRLSSGSSNAGRPPCDPLPVAQHTVWVRPRQPSPGPVSGSPGAFPPSGPAPDRPSRPARPGCRAWPGGKARISPIPCAPTPSGLSSPS